MVEIKLEPNDQQDILDLLNYALEKKKEEKNKQVPPSYWELRVPQLKKLINGLHIYDTIYQSSMGNLTGDIERGLEDDDSTKKRNI